MKIRPAVPAESPALESIVREAYGHYVARIGREPAPMTDDYPARIANGEAFVLDDEGIVGLVVLIDEPGGLQIENVAVRPRAQGKGYGRSLIAFAESEARRRGHDSIRLYTHALMTENISLYRRLGFVETHRATDAGFDRVYMVKQLA